MNRETAIRAITDTLQAVYGDATQTALDRLAAERIHDVLIDHGFASRMLVLAIVEAAGGEVRVPVDIMVDPPNEISTFQDPATQEWVITARRRVVA